jgi:hypothetical protein
MKRPWLRLFLAAHLLLTQGLGTCHAHPEGDQDEAPHTARHFHIGDLPFLFPHTHDPCTDEDGDEGPPAGDHEEDTIYVPDPVALVRLSSPESEEGVPIGRMTAAVTSVDLLAVPRLPVPLAQPPPLTGRFACPLFLQTLTLRL